MRFNFFPLALAASVSLPAFAAADAGSSEQSLPDEIIVSGYRPVAARELGTSISVLSSETLETAVVEHFQELVHFVPNMNLSGEGSRARYLQIRGIGEREQYEGAPNPSVGFVVDDIDLSGIGGVTSSFDLQRIEVLRGPQSARYGSSALAGIVYAQSTDPGEEIAGKAELTGGSDGARAVGLALGGPISEQLGGRLSVYQYQDNGFRDNVYLGRDDTNARDELTVRGKLNWQINSDWVAKLSLLHADFANGYDAFSLDNGPATFSDEPGEDSQQTSAASLRIAGSLSGAIDFVSISAVADSESLFSYDGDWVNEDFWLPVISDYRYVNPRERDSLSQELRLLSGPGGRLFGGSTDWVAGFSWQRLDEENRIDSTGDYVDTSVGCDPGFCVTDRQIRSRYLADTFALFGTLDTELTEKINLSMGLRLERWDAEYADNWLDSSIASGSVEANNRFSPDDSMLGGHVAVNYKWSEDFNSYARISRGFKAGGFNPSLAALGALPDAPPARFIEYSPEYLWNYELGLHWKSLGGDLYTDISIFYVDRDDAQLSQSSQVDLFDPNTFFFVTSNGSASVYGLEGVFAWQINSAWQLHGALGLMESEIEAAPLESGVVGRDLAHAPDYTVSLGVMWEGNAGWYFRADAVAVDGYYFDISHNQRSASYELVNMTIGKGWSNWSLDLWGRNIFDESYSTRGFFFGNEPPDFTPQLYTRFGDPRQVGLTLQFEF